MSSSSQAVSTLAYLFIVDTYSENLFCGIPSLYVSTKLHEGVCMFSLRECKRLTGCVLHLQAWLISASHASLDVHKQPVPPPISLCSWSSHHRLYVAMENSYAQSREMLHITVTKTGKRAFRNSSVVAVKNHIRERQPCYCSLNGLVM